jgi:cytochrome bd-type quinol oxidase subunit 1
MTDLLAARSQMAMSLAVHIIFASIGVAMPVMKDAGFLAFKPRSLSLH